MDIHLMVMDDGRSYVLRYTQSEYEEVYIPAHRAVLDRGERLLVAGRHGSSHVVNMNALAIAKLKE